MIVCGWCGVPTRPGTCVSCGRDAALPWLQRATDPPPIDDRPSHRPPLDKAAARRRVADAKAALASEGRPETVEAIAERLDVSPRTVRRWLSM